MAITPLKKHRQFAFDRQNGKCCYCGFQMWCDSPERFAQQYGLSLAQAWHFQCTAEHVVARQDGGKDEASNIVAACWRCNQLRHKRKCPPTAIKYQEHVQRRLNQGGWHTLPAKAQLKRNEAPNLPV
jgi:5-methylcytosine-specific restriction endonuclease McrA